MGRRGPQGTRGWGELFEAGANVAGVSKKMGGDRQAKGVSDEQEQVFASGGLLVGVLMKGEMRVSGK